MYDYPHYEIVEGPYKGTVLWAVSAGYVNDQGQHLAGFATGGTYIGGKKAWQGDAYEEPPVAYLRGKAIVGNPPSERKYKGMIIKKSGKMWNVEAFDKNFKTLKAARDFISKKVSGAASANGPCPRVVGKTKCKGTVILVRGKWKCKACKAEFREA